MQCGLNHRLESMLSVIPCNFAMPRVTDCAVHCLDNALRCRVVVRQPLFTGVLEIRSCFQREDGRADCA